MACFAIKGFEPLDDGVSDTHTRKNSPLSKSEGERVLLSRLDCQAILLFYLIIFHVHSPCIILLVCIILFDSLEKREAQFQVKTVALKKQERDRAFLVVVLVSSASAW